MRKYIFLFFSIIASGLFSSCSDMLDLQNDGRIDMSAIFSDRFKTMGYLNSCYNTLPHPYTDYSGLCDEAEEVGDINSDSKFSAWYTGSLTATNIGNKNIDGNPWYGVGESWEYYYNGIRKCNVFLANIKGAQIDATAEEKAGWSAQAFTLRALYYLQLVKRYGEVPLYTKPVEVNYDFSKDTRTKVKDVVKSILADCDSALAVPATQNGFPWELYNNQVGIMSRAVAYAIKSEAVTYAASPLFTDGTYTWADAAKINAEALSQCLTHDYSLYSTAPSPTDAQNAYAKYFTINFNADNQRTQDKETIYQGGPRMSVWYYNGLPSTVAQASAGVCPSQELVDSYEMANGEPAITGYTDANHLTPIINSKSGYSESNPYEGRDPRFYASIYYNGAVRRLDAGTAGMKFNATASFTSVTTNCPSWSNNVGNLTFTLYKWNKDYATSIKGTPVATKTFENYTDNEELTLTFGAQPAGTYLWELSNPTETVGVWKLVDGTSDAVSYYAGGEVSGNYFSRIAYAPNVYTSLVKDAHEDWKQPVQVVPYQLVNTYVDGSDGIMQTGWKNTRTGYYLRKFNHYASGLTNEADGAVRLFRLAELYLNFAESAYQSTGDPEKVISLGSGLNMSARDAVNAIRNRAGMPDLPSGLGRVEFEKKYRNERRIEFAFEGHRFFDVRRWKILNETDKVITGMRITKEGNTYKYNRFKFNDRNSYTNKWLLFPLDQSNVNKMLGFTGVNWQNPGW
ncbi:MAG: RagB/SusD family nutrient uptake outer membrane protein [Bacteroidota bacterium]|nr:RagB/SusD family nutrient uptake outer membrane protein [Bacteroidota bacterium]